jgi:uncharacterized protein (TIGR00661 family)
LLPLSDQFINDFARCRAVIGGSGFTLVARSIYGRKPLLAVPAGGQIEQIFNASYLGALGYGAKARELTPDALSAFLDKADSYRNNLSSVRHDGNSEILSSLDRMLGS